MTIEDIIIIANNFHSYNRAVKKGDTIITPIIIRSSPNRNKVLVTNKANPYGFYVYSDGEVETLSDIDDILPELTEKQQDEWVIETFGIFK